MDGFHDLGGTQGLGQVPHKINTRSYKPVFHQEWEHLAYSLVFLGVDQLKKFSLDEVRHAVERIEFRQHANTEYYERYVIAAATLLVEKGVITQAALDQALGKPFQLAKPVQSAGRPALSGRAGFNLQDTVMVRNEYIPGHIRAPAYVRGKRGVVIHKTSETWPFPDAIGHGDLSAAREPTYHVQFSAKELWGEGVEDGSVVVDLFESYLDKV